MSKKNKIWIIILVLCIFIGGIYFMRLRYYYYNKYNVYAKRAILEMLNYRYDEEFKLISTEFETRENEDKSASYIHVWTYTFEDGNGRRFNAYLWGYGVVEKGDGNSHADDYGTYKSDSYGQLLIEECMGKEFELYNYKREKNKECPDVEDYLFICKDDEEVNIAEILTQMFFKEETFSENGCLECLVKDENGKTIFVYSKNAIKRDLQKKNVDVTNITEETIRSYILHQLKG